MLHKKPKKFLGIRWQKGCLNPSQGHKLWIVLVKWGEAEKAEKLLNNDKLSYLYFKISFQHFQIYQKFIGVIQKPDQNFYIWPPLNPQHIFYSDNF